MGSDPRMVKQTMSKFVQTKHSFAFGDNSSRLEPVQKIFTNIFNRTTEIIPGSYGNLHRMI